jgi:hypothetical protein
MPLAPTRGGNLLDRGLLEFVIAPAGQQGAYKWCAKCLSHHTNQSYEQEAVKGWATDLTRFYCCKALDYRLHNLPGDTRNPNVSPRFGLRGARDVEHRPNAIDFASYRWVVSGLLKARAEISGRD